MRILLDDLFRVEAPRLQRYLRRRVRPDEDARDFVQEAFARLASTAARAIPAQPAAYLQRIVRNLLIDRSRRQVVVSVAEVDDIPDRAEQEDALVADDVMAIYESALASLPERTSTVFRLHRTEALPYREIAERLDMSISGVHKHVAKALEHIAWALQGGE